MAKVLVLSPTLSGNPVYPPWQLCGALSQGGHQATLAGPRNGPLWAPLADGLAQALVLPGRWGGWPRSREAVAAAQGVDAVVAFKAWTTSLGVGLAVRGAHGTPVVAHLDDWDAGYFHGVGALRRIYRGLRALGEPGGDLWLRWMEGQVRRADAVTVSTRALQKRFGGTLLRQGVDTGYFSPQRFVRDEARARLGVDADGPMVLFLGTPRQHKGLASLGSASLGSAGELAQALWFVGASGDALRQAGLPQAVLDRCSVVGPVPFQEAAWYLAASDVFVVPQSATPYAQHQLPAKLLHAMALGCAVVTTDVGDAKELLGGDEPAGVVTPSDDPQALVQAVSALLEDPGRRTALGAEARRRAEAELGWGAMCRTSEGVLREVGVHV